MGQRILPRVSRWSVVCAAVVVALLFAAAPAGGACPTITISPSSLPGGNLGDQYHQTLMASPVGTTYTFSVTAGSLPTGLTLDSFGVISGTLDQPGSFTFEVTAVQPNNCPGKASYTIDVGGGCPPPAPFLTASPTSVSGGQAINLSWNSTISADDEGSYTVLLSINGGSFQSLGTLPSSDAPTLSFTYTASNLAGTYDFEVEAAKPECEDSISTSNVARVMVNGPCPQARMINGLVLTPTSAAPGATFTLSWAPLGDYTGSYGVFRSTDGGQNFQLLGSTAATSFTGTVTDPPGTTVTFEVEALVSCIYPTRSSFVTLTVVSINCPPPGAVSGIQVRAAGVQPARAPAPTEYISVSWTDPVGGTPVTRHGVRVNGDPEVSVQGTAAQLPPRGARLDPIQVFVKAYGCAPEKAGPESHSDVVALFLTAPKASFSVSADPRVNAPIVFTDTSAPQATSWLWVFDDGTTDLHQSPSHVFTVPGPHVVFLFASNGAGTAAASKTVVVGATSAARVVGAGRIVAIDASDPGRRRARVEVVEGRTWLTVRALREEPIVLFLRFLDAGGEAVLERRLVVESGTEAKYDLSAYGLRGEYGIELVGEGEYEVLLTLVGRPGVRGIER